MASIDDNLLVQGLLKDSLVRPPEDAAIEVREACCGPGEKYHALAFCLEEAIYILIPPTYRSSSTNGVSVPPG